MKLIHKLPVNRSQPRTNVDFTSIEREELLQWNQSKSIDRSVQFNCLNTFAVVREQTSINQTALTKDNTATRVSTHPVCDSRRQRLYNRRNGNQSMLNIKQVQTEPQEMAYTPSRVKRKNSRKIYVSISKTNRKSLSPERRVQTSPRALELGGKPIDLYPLQKKRRVMNIIQMQLNETVKDAKGFC